MKKSFYFNDDVCDAARNLLGKVLYVEGPEGICGGMIVETEAYSYRERACHAYGNRRTARTETLFSAGGSAYVYLCYGIHRLFNVVTNAEGIAEAVLIRALEPVTGVELMKSRRGNIAYTGLTSGPGKLSEALSISLEHDGRPLLGDQIWISDEGVGVRKIVEGPRIGVDYAGEDALLPWRFGIGGNRFLSRPFPR
nr:DNA-3-methyladenine glycosylase [Fulvivirga sedimenti]